jgi:hypothetical protein
VLPTLFLFQKLASRRRQPAEYFKKEKIMDLLMTIGIILLILWLLGLVTSYTLGGFIHLLLVLAIIVILVRVIQGRKAIP